MNIFLVPYTWARHVAVALVLGSAIMVHWWVFLHVKVLVIPFIGFGWRPFYEGPFLLGTTAAWIAAFSMLSEGALRRSWWVVRLLAPIGCWIATFLFAFFGVAIFQLLTTFVVSKSMASLALDDGYTSLRYKIWLWPIAGWAAGLVPLLTRIAIARKLHPAPMWNHLLGGLAAGLLGGLVWHFVGYYGIPILGAYQDLYYAAPAGLAVFAVMYGLLVWPIPDELYAGWVRVLSAHRFGHRIPVDRPDGKNGERFLGHYPRGLDVFLPADKGVAELHVSFVTDGQQRYAVRGLSIQHTLVKRPLERIDMRYDPRRPAPLETELQPEDRILMGPGTAQTEVEFLLLPREEK